MACDVKNEIESGYFLNFMPTFVISSVEFVEPNLHDVTWLG